MKESSLTTGTSGTQEPVIEKLQPEIEGIIISARGGGSAQVKAEISEAMEALFGLPAHKIKDIKAGGIKEHKVMKMKRIFRRNQIIITTLAIMIAAAGYLNYSGKKEVAGGDVYEAGVTEISDEDILAENQAVSGGAASQNAENVSSGDVNGDGGQLQEIASLDDPNEGDSALTGSDQADGSSSIDNPGEAVLTGGTSVTDYIANVQLNRSRFAQRAKRDIDEHN